MKRNRRQSCNLQSSGFTLVEMLVSVTLVLLMMTLFASVFQIATGSMSTQRANSENDQKVRALTTVLRADAAKRVFRNLQPYLPGESSSSSPTNFGDRGGYWYISTNAMASGLDDVLQFTIDADVLTEDLDQSPYFGRAVGLVDPVNGTSGLTVSPNQPELDDGQLSPNRTASSSAAEVCYFVRDGNLYRRLLLIREPLAVAGQELQTQPTSFQDVDFFSSANFTTTTDGASDDFYRFFDFSARPSISPIDPTPATTEFTAAFTGVDSLNNAGLSTSGPLVAFGKPAYRFGFDPFTGRSREHLGPGGITSGFMGRYLHSETSDPRFNWPQRRSTVGTGNPFDTDSISLTLNQFGIAEQFNGGTAATRGGARTQEDLLLANVHEFRVELWDERIGEFVTPGYGEVGDASPAVGDFHISRNLNATYGPDNVAPGTVFDTWHPDNANTPQANQLPPYHPYLIYPPNVSAGGISPNGTGTLVVSNPPTTLNVVGFWEPDRTYNVNDVVFPRRTQILSDVNGNGTFDTGPGPGPNNDTILNQGFQFAYRCIEVATTDLDGDGSIGQSTDETALLPSPEFATGPNWPTTQGRRFTEGDITWQAIDNRRPLRAVRLTIRFLNEKSNDIRQLTLQLRLADEQ